MLREVNTNPISMKKYLGFLFLLFACHLGMAQETTTPTEVVEIVKLTNPSFEGDPQDATVPVGWFPCTGLTTPDILPGYWGVYNEASEGETYVGLITRSNGTWESIGQRFSSPLEVKTCYAFSVDLAHSNTYAGYSKPLKLRVWGGRNRCDKEQIIAETPFIEHTDWETYKFTFTTNIPMNYIFIEAFFRKGRVQRNGNILIDNISVFKVCPRA